jgi:glycosyltransferase involved in cell wall biosynthesis
MRVLMLNYEFPPLGGGASNANYYMFKEFAKWGKKRIKIDLVTSSAKNEFEEERFAPNINIYKLDVGKKKMQYWTMSEIFKWTRKAHRFSKGLIKKNKYDLCHCWFGWPGGIIGYRSRQELPYVVALRGSDVPGFNPRLKNLDPVLFKPISKKVWKNASAVIPNSEGLRKLAGKTLKREFTVIYNGIDTEQFKPPETKEFSDKVQLVSTGRLIERKGFDHLIDALKGLDDFELTLIGEGNLEDELKEQAKKNKVRVSFPGRIEHEDIPGYLQEADIFVLPSLNEGMSNSLLEAMACGLPVLVTDVGGSKELVKDNGFVVKKGSVKALKDALLKYDRKIIKKQGKQSRKIAEDMSWERVCEKYFEIYGKAIGH